MASIDLQVREYLGHLRVERNLSSNTQEAYRRDLERYVAFLAALHVRDVSDVQAPHVNEYQAHLLSKEVGLARTSANRMLAAVRGFHAFAIKEKWTQHEACAGLVPAKPATRLPKALSVDETFRLLDALAGSESLVDMRDYALVEFLYATGARISEVCGLTLDDIDTKGRSVRLFGKGGKTRVVPVGTTAIAALDRYLVRARPTFMVETSNYVFLNRKGRQLGRQSAFNAVSRCAELAHIRQDVSPHTLRHCFATHLLEGGADVRIVQELLGHASVTTTQIYTLVTQQRLREVYSVAHPRSRR